MEEVSSAWPFVLRLSTLCYPACSSALKVCSRSNGDGQLVPYTKMSQYNSQRGISRTHPLKFPARDSVPALFRPLVRLEFVARAGYGA
jgi:hypothetical protein